MKITPTYVISHSKHDNKDIIISPVKQGFKF